MTPTSLNVAAYVRVSTDEQTTANQLPEIEALCRGRGWTLAQTYSETGSAAKARPTFARMLEDAKRGRFNVLVIWALDRFGRNLAGNLDDFRRLAACGVRVVSVRETWLEQEGPTRDLLAAIFSWVAEQERTRLVERTRAGLKRARAEGVRLGRPPVSSDKLGHGLRLLALGHSVPLASKASGVSASTLRREWKRRQPTSAQAS